MGVVRNFSPHVRWTEAEVGFVRERFQTATWSVMLSLLPGRSRSQIQNKANLLGLVRLRAPKMSDAERARRKREGMARRWREKPEEMRAYARQNHAANKESRNAYLREMNARRLFWSRANRLKGVTARQLARLWRQQRGCCALSGVKLDRTAQIDHVIPRARGGGDELPNLQWVSVTANLAKRDLTQDEFLSLCRAVVARLEVR